MFTLERENPVPYVPFGTRKQTSYCHLPIYTFTRRLLFKLYKRQINQQPIIATAAYSRIFRHNRYRYLSFNGRLGIIIVLVFCSTQNSLATCRRQHRVSERVCRLVFRTHKRPIYKSYEQTGR